MIGHKKADRQKVSDKVRGAGWGYLKGVFAKNERGYRLNAIKKRF